MACCRGWRCVAPRRVTTDVTDSSLTVTLVAVQYADRSIRGRVKYQTIKGKVHHDLLNRLNLDRLTQMSRREAEPEIRSLIDNMLDRESQTTPLTIIERESLINDVLNEIFGLGPLEALLKDPAISDILINKPSQIYIEREGRLEETDIVFRDDRHLMQIIERIVCAVGRRVDESSPMVDARLQDGSRVNVIIPPLALDGPVHVDPAFPHRQARRRRPGHPQVADAADARVPDGRGRRAVERHRLRRHRRR